MNKSYIYSTVLKYLSYMSKMSVFIRWEETSDATFATLANIFHWNCDYLRSAFKQTRDIGSVIL